MTSAFVSDTALNRFHRAYHAALSHLPDPDAEHDVATRYGTVRVYRFGHGPGRPLVLLPGNGATTALWLPNIPVWSQHRTVLAVEPLGDAGPSTQDRPIRTADDQAAWLADTLDGLEPGPAHLVGVSYGAWLAANLAVHDPDRLASLTLIEPAQVVSRFPVTFLPVALGASRAAPEWLRRRALRWIIGGGSLDTPTGHVSTAVAAGHRTRLPPPGLLSDDQLRGLTTPTLLLIGAESRTHDALRTAERARALLPDVRVEVVPGVGHSLSGQRADLVNARVLDFTASCQE
ncbi:alpha/beta fold hydrolase [Pseudonocardia alni]|uniref:Pimeloyl-ACP methyl ester carboxylesterase n=1 Tax=Pseudonocardia alni TaxID=33907 RepID=A0A852WDI7_PSEA5|nr:alpha/beta fold hydrolase [Pseudonocardia antarctica]NYG05431.1 pimeloyl-ACP methyl ester carboxylesterase [Pseudonocardia antarctica]